MEYYRRLPDGKKMKLSSVFDYEVSKTTGQLMLLLGDRIISVIPENEWFALDNEDKK